ncbi:MAG: CRISPR-associated endonuclease Cas3'' [Candidatus Alcyoniella australis]|nr:CRISPR-associated endonuclease Cas3'' [Candidatus Alcyoniella australis]
MDELAHVDERGRGQLLSEHLRGTAELAKAFADKFASGASAELAALAHDLGKTQPAFQGRLRGENRRVRHAYVGAAELFARGELGCLLAAAVAGHHGGLADFIEFAQGIRAELDQARRHLAKARERGFSANLPQYSDGPPFLKDEVAHEFWLRMVFSALVDADYLDTERFFDPERAGRRDGALSIAEMKARLDDFLAGMTRDAEPSPINAFRARVLAQCRAAASLPPGLFSLTVPTGGGKTLSSMAFGLDHAAKYGLERVIVVIPYTSIIEQNSQVYRGVFGDEAVIEHHSAVKMEMAPCAEVSTRARLAAENWDSPLVVTTSVQFFESLFANRPGRCRKLHNIARSVVVLDEVQTLPAKLLAPILDGLNTLARDYGVSIVLSTATQPALRHRDGFPLGLTDVREIVTDPLSLFKATSSRTNVTWPADLNLPTTWEALADRLAGEACVLCVVHRRDDAWRLTTMLDQRLGNEQTVHLSATMCAEHRLATINAIRATLRDGRPIRVVSTQLVEAGVDLDFPVVYRALGGLDSIAQAAGRCNREGRLAQGRVEVFVAQSNPPRGVPTKALEVTRGLLAGRGALDIHDPEIYDEFFQRLFFLTDSDAKDIQGKRKRLAFKQVAEAFRMIEDDWSEGVIVPFGRAADVIDDIDRRVQNGSPISWRHQLRRLQRFTVQIPRKTADEWRVRGHLLPLGEEVAWRLSPDVFQSVYDQRFGLVIRDGESWMPSLIV